MSRGARAGLVAGGWLLVAATVAYFAGVGGYRAGWLLLAVVLIVVPVALLALLGRSLPSLGTWAVVVGVCGVVATAVLVDRAPPSKGRLADQVDGLELPFFELVDARSSGSSWCRPDCPRVTRVWRAPGSSPLTPAFTVVQALHADRLAPPPEEVLPRDRRRTIDIGWRSEQHDVRVLAEVVAADGGGSETRVRLVVTARR